MLFTILLTVLAALLGVNSAKANEVVDEYESSTQAKQAKHANDFLRSVYKDSGYGKEKRQAAKKTAKRI